ncbi:Transferase protein [Actinidia chinensis var. chinensis]|uniref:Transferase protein n=1 Tax=Actinidia chinensis var. chinensis TaxID=1590841 RepID=A0A2R6PLG2_ACTCC|nr:Transferase protein [Actinidia chinensis var. chinensis]
MPSSNSQSLSLVSKCTVFPETKSTLEPLKLSVSDLPMLSTHYIQKGLLFTRPRVPFPSLLSLLKTSLSTTLSLFPPLAGRLTTDSSGHVFIACNDAGADFLHVSAPGISIVDILSPVHVPDFVKEFFDLDRTVSYEGHFRPILAVQVTELADGIFIGCSVNHAVTDGTSLWNFFNTFAEVCRGARRISRVPDFRRESVLISPAVLRFPDGCPKVTFSLNAPLRERIFSFSRASILNLKHEVNDNAKLSDHEMVEIMGKQSNDTLKIDFATAKTTVEISSFQSLCALLWRAVTRARKLPAAKKTTFRMAVNVRHRVDPKLDPLYFGNAIQSIPTYATAREVRSRGLRWCAEQLNKSVVAYDDAAVKRVIEDWESDPKCFPLGNFDGAILTMGSSPRFPMYDNNFGWGRPMAIRSGRANKFDGKISAFPGREGSGSVDLEVLLAPETMAGLESDPEFMQYVSGC